MSDAMPSSKKRAAGREITKDNPGLDDDDENVSEEELETFKKASEQVLATRRIVKVRRQTSSSAAPASNPFAGIQLVPPKVSDMPIAAAPVDKKAVIGTEVDGDDVAVEKAKEEIGDGIRGKTEEGNGLEKNEIESLGYNENTMVESDSSSKKETLEVEDTSNGVGGGKTDEVNGSKVEESDEANKVGESGKSEIADTADINKVDGNSGGGASNWNQFQQLSGSKNAFTGFTGTGFSGSAFSFNPIPNDQTAAAVDSSPSGGQKTDQPLFSFGLSANSSKGSLSGAKDSSLTKSETAGVPSLQEVPTETGEENEMVVFSAGSALFEYLDGGWKERGRGEVKVNVSTLEGSKARLVMRTRGNLRLILNASLFPEMKLTYMDKKGITFACVNSSREEKAALSTYALKFKDGSVADEFHAVVEAHKGSPANKDALKTPENSPQ